MRNGAKILIVDDEKASATMLAEVVKRMGFKAIVANKPNDAINIVKLQSINAAIVDILMPKMSGVELVLELRQTKFSDAPVLLVSGVFKDKAFAAEAIKKTNAAEFLFKPFGADELSEALKRSLSHLLVSEKWTIQTLLQRKLGSVRERTKAIEGLDKINGADFPLVLSFLMEADISGHLNIVSDMGEIFGVTLAGGAISEVDSTESQANAVLALISKGLMAQQDWDEFQKREKGRFTVEQLVQEGVVSPHASSVAKQEQILADFKSICSANTLQMNFVYETDTEEVPRHGVQLPVMLTMLESSFQEIFSHEYLVNLYQEMLQAPISLKLASNGVERVFQSPVVKVLKGLKQHLGSGMTLNKLLETYAQEKQSLYYAIHHLILGQVIQFSDIEQEKNQSAHQERFEKLYADLKPMSPEEIFAYFGANEKSPPSVIKKIFDDYERSNNPELFENSSDKVKELAKKCYDLMASARDVMMDDNKRAELLASRAKESQSKKKRSNELTVKGLSLVRSGSYVEALELLRQADALHRTTQLFLITIWAEFKSGVLRSKSDLGKLISQLDGYAEEERSAYYWMTVGLVKKALGDPTAARAFERALETDSQFIEARKELTAVNVATKAQNKKVDIFKDDLSTVVSQLFRRKID